MKQTIKYLILALLMGFLSMIAFAPLEAIFGMVRVALSGMMMLILVSVVLSWVQGNSPIGSALNRLCEPVLRPVRRFVPIMGGIDFSPLVAMVILQVLLIVLKHLRITLMSLALA